MRSARWNIIVRKLEGRSEKLLGWQEGNEVCMYSWPSRRADGYRALRGWDENIVQYSGEKGSDVRLYLVWRLFVGQMEGQMKRKVWPALCDEGIIAEGKDGQRVCVVCFLQWFLLRLSAAPACMQQILLMENGRPNACTAIVMTIISLC